MKMTHAQWMKDTAAFGRVRSKELKALDNALMLYEQALTGSGSVLQEKKNLQNALEAWKAAQKAKGQDWRSSVRNKLKAVEKLDAELGHVIMGAGGLSSRGDLMVDPEEMRARKIIADHIKQNTRTMFMGQKLTMKTSSKFTTANDVRGAVMEFKGKTKAIVDAAKGVAPDTSAAQTLLVKLFGDLPMPAVMEALGGTVGEFIGNVAPFLGAVKSAGQAAIKWGKVAKGLYDKHGLSKAELSFAPGDPAAAFEAILRIQQREINANLAQAGIYSASAVAKTAFTAADFGGVSGPLLGAAESMALLVQKVYAFARDWIEMREANELLAKGPYDLTLFKTCPLLGCYLIGNSNTSDIINMAVGDYGKTGWMLEVEVMVRKAQPVFEKSREVIRGSRYEIAGMQGMKGVVADRKRTTLGLPTGKLDGAIDDVSAKIKGIFK